MVEKLLSLPTPSGVEDPAVTDYLNEVKTLLDGLVDVVEKQTVTPVQLEEAITQASGLSGSTTVINTGTEEVDTTIPPALTGLTATASANFVLLQWDGVPGNNFETRIYRNTIDDFSTSTFIGTSRTLLYPDSVPADVPDTQIYYYWIRTFTQGEVEGPINQTAGTQANPRHILGSEITDGSINDSAMGTIGADKVITASLAAWQAVLGDVITGTMKSSDVNETFVIDLINKFIEIAGNNGRAADDYLRIELGSIVAYEWTGSTHQISAQMRNYQNGEASSGQLVVIPSYYKLQPIVRVYPKDMPVYDASTPGQNQTIKYFYSGLVESSPGSGSWQFTANSDLVLGDGTDTQTPGAFQTATNANITTITYFTLDNTESFIVNMTFLSVRGTGSGSIYNHRKVTWTVNYRIKGSASAFSTQSQVKTIGAQISTAVADSMTILGLSGTDEYEFFVSTVYADTGATFNLGGPTTLFHESTLNRADVFDEIDVTNFGNNSSQVINQVTTLPVYTPPDVGYTIYESSYSWKWGHYGFVELQPFHTGTGGSSSVSGRSGSDSASVISGGSDSVGSLGAGQAVSKSAVVSSSVYDRDYITGILTAIWDSDGDLFGTTADNIVQQRLTQMSVTVKSSKPVVNDTNAYNSLTTVSIIATLTGATVLQPGSLYWDAVNAT